MKLFRKIIHVSNTQEAPQPGKKKFKQFLCHFGVIKIGFLKTEYSAIRLLRLQDLNFKTL
jgi:hypothetical protein